MKTEAIFVDYLKAFDTLNHRLLQAKPKALGLKPAGLKPTEKLTSRYQKVSNVCSFLSNLVAGIPQGSVLGPLLYQIALHVVRKWYSK